MDIFNINKQTIETANINFLDVSNNAINTLTIKGGQYIRLINNLNNALMDLDNSQVSVTPNLKLFNNLVVDGIATISNIYTKTEVNNLISAGSGSNSNAYTKTESDNLLNLKTNTGDFNTLSTTVNAGLLDRYTKTESNNRYYTKSEIDLIDVSDYVNIFNVGAYTALNLNHSYGMRFGIGTDILMTMDVTSGIAMNTSLFVDNNLSISGSLIVEGTDILSSLTDIQSGFNNVYTKTQSDTWLTNKQAILNSSSLITVDKITATTYAAIGNHAFADSVGTTRLLLGAANNIFTYKCVIPSIICNSTAQNNLISTTSASTESVEIGLYALNPPNYSNLGAMIRIASDWATIRLETIGARSLAFSLQRNGGSGDTYVMINTTKYQIWNNGVNTFPLPIVCSGLTVTGSSALNVSGNSTLNNLTVNGTVTGITKAKILLTNVDDTSDLNKPLSTATTTALNLKQNSLTIMPGTGEDLLTTNYIKRIFGKAPLNVSTFFDSSAQADPRNNNIEISSDLKWYAGSTYITTTTNSSNQFYSGNLINVRTITETLPAGLFTNVPRIYVSQTSGNNTNHASIIRIYTIDATTSSFKIIVTDFGSASGYEVSWLAIDELSMGMD